RSFADRTPHLLSADSCPTLHGPLACQFCRCAACVRTGWRVLCFLQNHFARFSKSCNRAIYPDSRSCSGYHATFRGLVAWFPGSSNRAAGSFAPSPIRSAPSYPELPSSFPEKTLSLHILVPMPLPGSGRYTPRSASILVVVHLRPGGISGRTQNLHSQRLTKDIARRNSVHETGGTFSKSRQAHWPAIYSLP